MPGFLIGRAVGIGGGVIFDMLFEKKGAGTFIFRRIFWPPVWHSPQVYTCHVLRDLPKATSKDGFADGSVRGAGSTLPLVTFVGRIPGMLEAGGCARRTLQVMCLYRCWESSHNSANCFRMEHVGRVGILDKV